MNTLMRTIESCMSSFESCGQGDLSATFSFPPDFAGFQGHFPRNPVLPAVCIIQAVMLMAIKHANRHVELKTISSAKWFSPTSPDTTLRFLVHITPDKEDEATIRAKISRGHDHVADLTLRINIRGPESEKRP